MSDLHALYSVNLSPLGRKIVSALIEQGEMDTHALVVAVYGDFVADDLALRRSAMKVIAKTVPVINTRISHLPYTVAKLGDQYSRTYKIQKVET